MLDLENAQSVYVLAAYGFVALGVLGLLFVSWRAVRQRQDEWRSLQDKRAKDAR